MSEIKSKFKEMGPEFKSLGRNFKDAFTESVPHIKEIGVLAGEAATEIGRAAKPHVAKAADAVSRAADKVEKKFSGEQESARESDRHEDGE